VDYNTLPVTLDLDLLQQLSLKPPLFEPGEPLFWDDPYISSQMLAFHLSPDADAASRKPETIDRTVSWLIDFLQLKPGDSVLDLGCGPGLYTARLSQVRLCVTGMDYSRRSIDYAITYAREHDLPITYHYQNYLTLDLEAEFDAVLLIYGDLCVLSPEKRDSLLDRIHRALKPGGMFICDVTTRQLRARAGLKNGWYAAASGFWKPGPHLVLEQGFDYPEADTFLDQYAVIEPDCKISVYRNWFLDYSRETITAALENRGFTMRAVWDDLTGTPYTPDGEWIGVAASV
jgi:SAM-dependent methyltransferase